MKISVLIIRVLMGLLFLFSVIAYFFKLMPQQELPQNAQLFMTGIFASGYIMTVVKVVELLVAISFLSNRLVALSTVVIFPITINILLFHAFMAPEGMAVPVFLFLGNIFLAYAYRKNYQPVLELKPTL